MTVGKLAKIPISKEDLHSLTQKKTNYINFITGQLKKVNPYCSFAIEQGRNKKGHRKKNSPLFRAIAHCTFTHCECKVMVTVPPASQAPILEVSSVQ